MSQTLEELRATKRQLELDIANYVSQVMKQLKSSSGQVVQGVELTVAVHYTLGKPDGSLLVDVKLDLGEI